MYSTGTQLGWAAHMRALLASTWAGAASEPSRGPLHLKPCVGCSCHPCVQSDSFKVSASHTFHWGMGDKLTGSSFHGSEHSKVKTAGSQMPPFQLPLPYNLLSLQHSDPPRMEPASTQDTGGSGKLEAKLGCVDGAQDLCWPRGQAAPCRASA